MKALLKFILCRVFGWEIGGALPEDLKKAVIIVAPHTSLWDFPVGRIAFWCLNVEVNFMIKAEAFQWPWGYFLRKLGGIPVQRGRPSYLLLQILRMYRDNDSFFTVITPEGTRALVKEWKRGFYEIATKANVPIVLAYIDYKYRKGGLGPVFYPTGDYRADLKKIEEFYKGYHGKHPERFNLTNKS